LSALYFLSSAVGAVDAEDATASLANCYGAKLIRFDQNLSEIWAKVIKIWANLIRFGQNQNLASSKTFNLLRQWF